MKDIRYIHSHDDNNNNIFGDFPNNPLEYNACIKHLRYGFKSFYIYMGKRKKGDININNLMD